MRESNTLRRCRKVKNEDYRKEWSNFNKPNFEQLKKHFEEVQWDSFFEVDNVEGKRDTFLRIYKGMEKWVTRMKTDQK